MLMAASCPSNSAAAVILAPIAAQVAARGPVDLETAPVPAFRDYRVRQAADQRSIDEALDLLAQVRDHALLLALSRLPERLLVGHARVLHAPAVLPERMLGPDAGIVQAGRNGMDVRRLAVVVLHHVAETAVENARLAET